jgi:hypothetical protein
MDFNGRLPLAIITAVLIVTVVLSFVASASSIFLGAQTKTAALQGTDDNGSLSTKYRWSPHMPFA